MHLGVCLRVDSNGPRVQHGLAIGEHGIGTGVAELPITRGGSARKEYLFQASGI